MTSAYTPQRVTLDSGSASGSAFVSTPSGAASSALTTQATSTVAGFLILKASAGNLYGYNIVTGASAGYLMIFDSATVPADGTVTPKKVIAIAANTSVERGFNLPIVFSTGITLVFSTTGPFTKTISNTAFISGEAV